MATDRTALQELPLEASVDGVPDIATGERVIWDDVVVGLGLRLRATGRHTWITQRRVQGRMRKQTLGSANELSLEQARVAAKALFEVQDAPSIVPTLAAFVGTFLRDCAGQWKQATQECHRRDLEKRVVPDLGHKRRIGWSWLIAKPARAECSLASPLAWCCFIGARRRRRRSSSRVLPILRGHEQASPASGE